MRLLIVLGPLRFDDDLWRYLWDGIVTAEGTSPYRFAPQDVLDYDPEFDPLLLDEDTAQSLERLVERAQDPQIATILEKINFPHLPTIYPPTSQVAFLPFGLTAPGQERTWRAGVAFLDLLVIALLGRLLFKLERPRWWASLYALHPLPALEFSGAGHQDALGIALLLAAGLALASERRALAGVWLTLAAGVKLFPAVLILPWWRQLGFGGLAAGFGVGVLASLPFLWLGPSDPAGLQAYVSGWEFFSGPYALLALISQNLFGPGNGRTVLFGLLVILALLSRFWRARTVPATIDFGGRWIEVLILCSPVVDPWYVPWGLAVGVLRGSLAWPLFAALIPLAYTGFHIDGHAWWLRALVWLPFLGSLFWELKRQDHGSSH